MEEILNSFHAGDIYKFSTNKKLYLHLSESAVQTSDRLVLDCPIPFVLLHISDAPVISFLRCFLVCESE